MSDSTKHTPGPWKAEPDGDLWWRVVEAAGVTKGNAVCESFRVGRDRGEADAKLAAAAPDMLAALKLLTQEIEAMHLAPVHDFNALRNGSRFALARAVIDKAEGVVEGM